MSRGNQFSVAPLCVSALFIIGCGHSHSGAGNSPSAATHADDKVVDLFIWADYLAPDTLSDFEKQTGIKVRVSNFDSPEAIESRMLVGNSGFDVVVPTVTFIQREIRSGAYLPLDKSKLPNLANLDPVLMSKIARNDPGNTYTVAYTWGTFGIGYNEKMVAKALPKVPLDSWRIILDPQFASKLASCGINLLDDPVGVVRMVLQYLGKNPDAPTNQDLIQVQDVLGKIRPYVRNIDTSGEIEALANGDICITLGYNGDVVQSRKRAREAKNGQTINFFIPKEGTELWVDLLAIPKDAPHVSNAYLLINYLMDPSVIAKISNAIGFANANPASMRLLDPAVSTDTIIYPTAEEQKRLYVPSEPTPEQSRAITRLWQKFKTGQ
jgi:putrescine transport system substrate-binding protein